jgi:hypothetical protein
MSRPFRSDRTWSFPVPQHELWDRIATVENYPTMWPWLRSFDGTDGLRDGAHWTCEVAPPLPYVVRFGIHFHDVDPGSLASTTVDGDIRGWARLDVHPTSSGCVARLCSELEPANALLRGFGRVARPVVEWGHDWILDQGRQQFVERVAFDD